LEPVAIAGVGVSKFGRRTDARMDELAWEAFSEALDDSGMTQKDVDQFVVSSLGGWSSEFLPAVVVGEYCGLSSKPTMRVEAACASGSAAAFQAYVAIASGQADVVAAIGVEKMSESPMPTTVEFIGRAGNYFWEFENFGLTFPGYYALYATAYMDKYGAKEKDFAEVAVKNHYYGSMNPKAQLQKRVTVEDVMKSRYVAWPIKLMDSSPITDGAAAVIFANGNKVKRFVKDPVWVRSIGASSGTSNLSKRDGFLGLDAAVTAAKQAYRKAGIDDPRGKFDVAEVHDCFTIAEVLAYEDLGIVGRGEGFKLAKEHQTYKGGTLPANLDGGLKAKGHPIGATGLAMLAELKKQLTQQVGGQRQADIKKGWALAHNIGGTGHYAFVTTLSLERGGV
jgi:acetyl-CoA C-acetyltransferase